MEMERGGSKRSKLLKDGHDFSMPSWGKGSPGCRKNLGKVCDWCDMVCLGEEQMFILFHKLWSTSLGAQVIQRQAPHHWSLPGSSTSPMYLQAGGVKSIIAYIISFSKMLWGQDQVEGHVHLRACLNKNL